MVLKSFVESMSMSLETITKQPSPSSKGLKPGWVLESLWNELVDERKTDWGVSAVMTLSRRGYLVLWLIGREGKGEDGKEGKRQGGKSRGGEEGSDWKASAVDFIA